MTYHPFDSLAEAQRELTATIIRDGYARQADWLRIERAIEDYREAMRPADGAISLRAVWPKVGP